MRIRTTLILFIIVILLLAFVYIFEIRKPKEDPDISKRLDRILGVKEEDINKLEISYAKFPNTIKCSKDKDGKWKLDQPSSIKLETKNISDLISQTLNRKIFDKVKEIGNLDEYGLENPNVSVKLELKDGTNKNLMIGNEVPVGNYVYIKELSSPEIYTIPASISNDFTKLVTESK